MLTLRISTSKLNKPGKKINPFICAEFKNINVAKRVQNPQQITNKNVNSSARLGKVLIANKINPASLAQQYLPNK